MADAGDLGRLRELLDRQDILDCLTRISRGIDRFDRELWLSGFHADAVIDAGQIVAPPEVMVDAGFAMHATAQSATQHNLTNHTCEIAGDIAYAETYWIYGAKNVDGTTWVAGGRYVDRLERRDGAWKIAFRQTFSDWSTQGPSASPPLFDKVADMHLNGFAARSREDPSYRRPFENRRALRLPPDAAALSPA
jgi:hypothetical protein